MTPPPQQGVTVQQTWAQPATPAPAAAPVTVNVTVDTQPADTAVDTTPPAFGEAPPPAFGAAPPAVDDPNRPLRRKK